MASVEHVSIPVGDIERARAFYPRVFPFEHEAWDESRGMLRTGGGIDGDLHLRGEVAHPTITVSVDDLDATLARLLEHGDQQIGAIEPLTSTSRTVYVRDCENLTRGVTTGSRRALASSCSRGVGTASAGAVLHFFPLTAAPPSLAVVEVATAVRARLRCGHST